MSPAIPASPSGTLVLQDREGALVQYSLEDIQAEFQTGFRGPNRIELSARLAGENFVDLRNRRDEELTLLLELWSEQRRLGASDEALATTRDRIERHIKKETAWA